jgi:hypothetical protein
MRDVHRIVFVENPVSGISVDAGFHNPGTVFLLMREQARYGILLLRWGRGLCAADSRQFEVKT